MHSVPQTILLASIKKSIIKHKQLMQSPTIDDVLEELGDAVRKFHILSQDKLLAASKE